MLIALAVVSFRWFRFRAKRHVIRKQPQNENTQYSTPDAELPLGAHHEKAELPVTPNHVSELVGDKFHTLRQEDQAKGVMGAKVVELESSHHEASWSKITGPAELAWDRFEPPVSELHGDRVMGVKHGLGKKTL